MTSSDSYGASSGFIHRIQREMSAMNLFVDRLRVWMLSMYAPITTSSALGLPTHVHHIRVSDWCLGHRREGWATCPVTESGFVRVWSNHRVICDARTPGAAAHLVARLRAVGADLFWSDAVTDAHMLLLARSNNGEVATFDRARLPDQSTWRAGYVDRIQLIL